jgi:uncharacterized protein (DUF3820 family)
MTLIDTSPMPFGKHKGTPMANVPAGYLLWLYDIVKPGDVKDYIRANEQALRAEVKK